ncbi:MAG: hypothetical protein M3Q39_09500, partial [Actinomycetota bacterium]|nr:hypothetical protein [Actinomycetota bacterium]
MGRTDHRGRPWENAPLWFLLHLRELGRVEFGYSMDPQTGGPGPVFFAGEDGSWSELSAPSDGTREAIIVGPCRRWQHARPAGHAGISRPDTRGAGMTDSSPLDPQLREELLARADRDQAARYAYFDAVERGEPDWSTVAAVDADNLAFLAPLLDEHGWLGSDLVGEDGASACWLLVQHAPPERQDTWLPLMERAVTAGLASAADLVYLQDRVSMHHDRPQSHGTQRLGYSEGH